MTPPTATVALADQPVQYVDEVGGIYFRGICLDMAYQVAPQHSHDYDHVTLVATGSVRLWIDGKYAGEFHAPRAIEIKARKKHLFQSLETMTRLYCVHNLNGKPYAILEEHRHP